jgi:hypothetical protein
LILDLFDPAQTQMQSHALQAQELTRLMMEAAQLVPDLPICGLYWQGRIS